jgi:hypothetical protein
MSKPATISYEDRESLSVGIDHGDLKNLDKIAYAVNLASEDAQEEYGKDAVLTVNGQPIDPLVGAAAIRAAYIKMHGIEPIGMEWQGMLPVTKPFETQDRLFRLISGETVLETVLESPRIWNAEKLSIYLSEWHPEFVQPKVVYPSHRKMLLAEVLKGATMIGMPTRTVDVPWGGVAWPVNEDRVDMTIVATEKPGNEFGLPNKMVARFIVVAKKMHAGAVDEFYSLVLEEVRRVYQNKYIVWNDGRISYEDVHTKVKVGEIILNEDFEAELETRIYKRIRNVEECRRTDRRMLSAKYVFSGEAGTGKTMTAQLIAMESLNNNWTVVLIQPGDDEDFGRAMDFVAQLDGPVLVIVEDLEKMMPDQEGLTTKQRMEERSKLLDRFDGGVIKGKEIVFILTTNFKMMWISAMARHGRCDGFWEFVPLDRVGFEKLMRIKLKGRLADDVDFDIVFEYVKDMSSSFLAAMADYARDDCLGEGTDYRLTTDRLVVLTRGLRRQYQWYIELVDNELSQRAQTLSEHYEALVGPIVDARFAAAGFATVK